MYSRHFFCLFINLFVHLFIYLFIFFLNIFYYFLFLSNSSNLWVKPVEMRLSGKAELVNLHTDTSISFPFILWTQRKIITSDGYISIDWVHSASERWLHFLCAGIDFRHSWLQMIQNFLDSGDSHVTRFMQISTPTDKLALGMFHDKPWKSMSVIHKHMIYVRPEYYSKYNWRKNSS